jgi:hypothetical protein
MKPCRRNCHGNNHSHIHTLVVPERWADWHATSVHIEGHSSWHWFGYHNNGGTFGDPPLAMHLLPLGMSKQAYAGTTSIFFTVCNLAKAVP